MKEILIAAISLVAGALVGPYVNWGIEKRKQKLLHRRDLIGQWRKMIVGLIRGQKTALTLLDDFDRREFINMEDHLFLTVLEDKPEYHSLKTQLSRGTIEQINQISDRVWDADVAKVIQDIIDEINSKEKEWGLV